MRLKEALQELYVSLLERVGRAWWVEMRTERPPCLYYFGPFASREQAEAAQPGYLEDLLGEQAEGITWTICQCRPPALTIENPNGASATSINGQSPPAVK